jgi:hypothetical protein
MKSLLSGTVVVPLCWMSSYSYIYIYILVCIFITVFIMSFASKQQRRAVVVLSSPFECASYNQPKSDEHDSRLVERCRDPTLTLLNPNSLGTKVQRTLLPPLSKEAVVEKYEDGIFCVQNAEGQVFAAQSAL